jgi:hypothetical protein
MRGLLIPGRLSARAPGTSRPHMTLPQPVLLAVDRDHDRAAMPRVAELRGSPTDLAGVDPAERLSPTPHCFVAGSWLTMIPRAASRSSTVRRLNGKRP